MRGQALAISLVISCGVATFVMSLSMHGSMKRTLAAYYDRYRFGQIFAHLKRAPDILVARLGEIPGVAQVNITQTGVYYAVMRAGNNTGGLLDQYILDVQILPTGSVADFANLQVTNIDLPTGSIQSGQTVSITYTVKNVGKGKSFETQANLRNLSGDGLLLHEGRFDLSNMQPGEVKKLTFSFDVESALEMREAVLGELPKAQVVIKAAAVADFRPASPEARKIKKEDLPEGAGLELALVRNPDILAEVCRQKGDRIVVGFAAESHDVIEAARRKLARKGCDLMVANDIAQAGIGFDSEQNEVSFVWPTGEVETLPPLPKAQVASRLLDRVRALREARA